MNIIEIYSNADSKNKIFLKNGVRILMQNEVQLSNDDLKDRECQIMNDLATDFSKNDPNWICQECGAPVVCDYITSYYEHYTCVGESQHDFTIS